MMVSFTKIAPKVGLIHISDTYLSDMFKDVNGYRPRHYKEWWTTAELKAEYDYLGRELDYVMKAEKKAEIKAVKKFKKLIKETISYGAGDRTTAIKWLVQGEGLDFRSVEDLKYFFWGHGLSYVLQNRWAITLSGKV